MKYINIVEVEKSKLKEAATLFPEFQKLVENNFLPRIKDLWEPFRKFHYYDSRQKGSASIRLFCL